jgi:hypothetical protein
MPGLLIPSLLLSRFLKASLFIPLLDQSKAVDNPVLKLETRSRARYRQG